MSYMFHKKVDENDLQFKIVQDTISLLAYANFNASDKKGKIITIWS